MTKYLLTEDFHYGNVRKISHRIVTLDDLSAVLRENHGPSAVIDAAVAQLAATGIGEFGWFRYDLAKHGDRMASISPNVTSGAIDVWLRFDDSYDDEMASYEANTYLTEFGYRIEWCHNFVGLVTGVELGDYAEVLAWYAQNDYEDYTVNDS